MDTRRISLALLPTPVHRLANLSEILGIDLWIKRDDLSGFAGGGNKARKLEHIIPDAIRSSADVMLTCGAAQSNFVRQAAAACSMHGIEFHAVVMDWPHPPGQVLRPKSFTSAKSGNLLLDEWLGAHIHHFADGTWDELEDEGRKVADSLREQGKRVYEVPFGGSTGVGALGFVEAAEELLKQSTEFDQIIVASGSGSTQTGLVYGLRRANSKTKVIGICSDNEPEMVEEFARIAEELDSLTLGKLRLREFDFDLRTDYCGKGYQVPTKSGSDAIRLLAQKEGIFLEPVYTAKAFAGLVDVANKGELPGKTLFWHTGGFPNLFAQGFEPEPE